MSPSYISSRSHNGQIDLSEQPARKPFCSHPRLCASGGTYLDRSFNLIRQTIDSSVRAAQHLHTTVRSNLSKALRIAGWKLLGYDSKLLCKVHLRSAQRHIQCAAILDLPQAPTRDVHLRNTVLISCLTLPIRSRSRPLSFYSSCHDNSCLDQG